MYLADSNIMVYSYLPQYAHLRDFLVNEPVFVSEISRVEVLGYHKITIEEEAYFKDLFSLVTIISPSRQIFDEAITFRKEYNLSLGDSIIAATASVHNLSIYTRNLSDFKKVIGVTCINPISH
jgi:predicted nucleic acid-binding protein